MYSTTEDPHFDHTGDGLAGSGGMNPEALLIIDRRYDTPYYMTEESGPSLLSGMVYRYIIRPSNLLQMLRNIFTLPFDTPGDDEWDTAYTGVRGYPTANGYVSMRSGGHTYEFLTSRDWDPPVWEIPSTEQNFSRQIGKMHVAPRGRPGEALEAINFLKQGLFVGSSSVPGGRRYASLIREYIDEDGAGGYGYPSNSRDFARYPKVDPVLSAHPWFNNENPLCETPAGHLQGMAPNPNYNFANAETGFPMPFQTSYGYTIDPDLIGAPPTPLNPFGRDEGGTESYWPWRRLAGPIESGVTGGYADSITTANASPRWFTNDDTIYPNYVNIYPDAHEFAFQGGKWTTDMNYMFRINYWQSENHAPAYIQLYVRKTDDSGNPLGGGSWMQYAMLKANPNGLEMRDGTVYYYEATGNELEGPGDYQYHFKASDGKGVAIFPNRTSDDRPETIEVTVAPNSTGNNFVTYTEFRQRFQAGVHMVGAPATPPSGRDRAVDIFDTDVVARWDAQGSPAGYVFGVDDPDASQLEVVARMADCADVTSVAGVGSGDASRGYRVENPPMMPGSVGFYFTDESGARLAHDIRPRSSGAMVRPFCVETDIADAEVEITLPDLSGVPNDLAFYLTDIDSGKRMYARTPLAYAFTTGADGALRHFELEVAPGGADNLTIRTASVQADNGGLMVTHDLSSAANVSIEVMNIAGRRVRTLIESRAAAAGSDEQMWDTHSSDGTVVPNGSYLIKIEAVAENGQRVQALRPAQIAR